MIKKLFFCGAFAALSLPSFAQYEKLDCRLSDLADHEVRNSVAYIGEKALSDTAKTVGGYVTMLQMTYSSQAWGDMYENWKWLITNAPIATVGTYARGAVMLGHMIKSDTISAEKKKMYLDEMMSLFDTRLKYLKYLNATVAEGKRGRATEGDVLISKANYYHIYGFGIDPNYTYNSIYDMYKAGINAINKEGGREVKGAYIQYFFSVSHELYKVDNNYFREQFLNDYLESKEVCEKMLQLAKEETDPDKAQGIVAEYDKPLAVIEQVFAQSGAANREQLIAMYTPKIEQNKTNVAYLRSAMNVLANNGCDDTDVYYTASRYAYEIEPTYESAIGMAQYSKKEGKLNEMLTYYNKALDMAQNDQTRGIICMNIAISLINGKQYTGALVYLDRAIQYNPEMTGKAALRKAIVYTSLGQYADALNYCAEASGADITVSGTAERLAEKIRKAQANAAENARARAAYDSYMAKQKAEEDFWKGK